MRCAVAERTAGLGRAAPRARTFREEDSCRVAVVGGGIAGLATAARLQAAGLSTVVLEAHGLPGGCAGSFRRRGFSFDVGATTLVDFEPGGVGGELLDAVGMPPVPAEHLPGYVAWLPDRVVTLFRDVERWHGERRVLGDSPAHRRLWRTLDRLARAFWRVSRGGARMPLRSLGDLVRGGRLLGLRDVGLARYLRWTLGDLLRHHGLREDRPLVGLLSMLVEDTVHSTVDRAPLINAALGITIRGAGLTRARGGMHGFWSRFVAHYAALGGRLELGCRVRAVEAAGGGYRLLTSRGPLRSEQVVSAVPAEIAALLGPPPVAERLSPYLRRDAHARGGALIVFLGVPESEVADHAWTHHQLMHDYEAPLGMGNNMFLSVSAPGDLESAPTGHRAVMISTHCDLAAWKGSSDVAYEERKAAAGARLVQLARRVYPRLCSRPVVYEVGTPRTYERFTSRPDGAVGGVRLDLENSNQRAIPHDLGVPGFHLVGDTTWPGLGTVACVLGSRLVARAVVRHAARSA